MTKLVGISHSTAIPSVANVRPKDDSDAATFKDLYEVLKKHDALNRFGICLLHDHFKMADDELMVESVDEAGRVLTLQPIKAEELDKEISVLETAWRFDEHPPTAGILAGEIVTQRCIQGCRYIDGPDGNKHYPTHKRGG